MLTNGKGGMEEGKRIKIEVVEERIGLDLLTVDKDGRRRNKL